MFSNAKAQSKGGAFSKVSLSINANASIISQPQMSNTELFLRHRTKEYLANFDADTALFFAERLLSEHDCLSSRLLVAKCYQQLHQYNHAYNVLCNVLYEAQTEYQRLLYQQNNNDNTTRDLYHGHHTQDQHRDSDHGDDPDQSQDHMHRLNLSGKTTPFAQGVLTPNGPGDFCYTPIRMEDNASANDTVMGFAFNTPNVNGNVNGHHGTRFPVTNQTTNQSNGSNGNKLELSHNHNGSMGAQSMGAHSPMSQTDGNGQNTGQSSFLSSNGVANPMNDFNKMNRANQLNPKSKMMGNINLTELFEARYFFALIAYELARYDECEEVL